MKRGRPTAHTKAKFVTFIDNGEETFFELDSKGNIIRNGKHLVVHHKKSISETETSTELPRPEIFPVPQKQSENRDQSFAPLVVENTDSIFQELGPDLLTSIELDFMPEPLIMPQILDIDPNPVYDFDM